MSSGHGFSTQGSLDPGHTPPVAKQKKRDQDTERFSTKFMDHKKLSRPELYVMSSELQSGHPATCIKMINTGYRCPSQISVSVSILGPGGSRMRAKENPELILLGQKYANALSEPISAKEKITTSTLPGGTKGFQNPSVICEHRELISLLQPNTTLTSGQIVRDVSC